MLFLEIGLSIFAIGLVVGMGWLAWDCFWKGV